MHEERQRQYFSRWVRHLCGSSTTASHPTLRSVPAISNHSHQQTDTAWLERPPCFGGSFQKAGGGAQGRRRRRRRRRRRQRRPPRSRAIPALPDATTGGSKGENAAGVFFWSLESGGGGTYVELEGRRRTCIAAAAAAAAAGSTAQHRSRAGGSRQGRAGQGWIDGVGRTRPQRTAGLQTGGRGGQASLHTYMR